VAERPTMLQVLQLIEKVAPTRANILVEGESGTGKELVARAIHQSSPRANGPFVPVNCGAIPDTLIEAELFGHAAGAYTGAAKARAGLFEAANGGTLLLDEVGELPANVQVKLLRVIQELTVRRVGDDKERPVDVRLVAATNRDLQQMVKDHEFREDLFYRLNVVRIRVPPLRERRDDIPLLARAFLEKYRDEIGKTLEGFSSQALERLGAFGYPGNVRELENVVERAVALASGPHIEVSDLPEEFALQDAGAVELSFALGPGFDLKERLNEVERGYIAAALDASGGVKTHAASLLGLTFRSFRHRLKKLGIENDEDEEVSDD
ncbi:MAG: sigma-54 dependent transcriptional regulator, partial [Myxococcota bacterium]